MPQGTRPTAGHVVRFWLSDLSFMTNIIDHSVNLQIAYTITRLLVNAKDVIAKLTIQLMLSVVVVDLTNSMSYGMPISEATL